MAKSSLIRSGEKAPVTNKGRDTRALGPSDRSDSGSDITGAPGLTDADTLPFDTGTTSDLDRNRRRRTAGPDIGDENLDSDSDSGGTGERGAAGRDAPPPTDQDLSVRDMSDNEKSVRSAEDLESELIEEDRELDEEAPSGNEATSRATVGRRRASKTPKGRRRRG
jgi:hypothetical protein